MFDILQNLLSANVKSQISQFETVNEIRLRSKKRLCVSADGKIHILSYLVSLADIDYALCKASKNSMYAVQDGILKGYITYDGGIRVGICGEGVSEKGKLIAVRNINSINIRVPKSVYGCAANLKKITDNFRNTLIISPPGAGKTTLLREMSRVISNKGRNLLIIDERNEISATINGESLLDVGCCSDISVGIPKLDCYESAVRTMAPEIIVTDEIFGKCEVDAICDCVRSGVGVLATIHGNSVKGVLQNPIYAPLERVIDNYVVLCKEPKVGCISEVIEGCLD